MEQIRLLIEAGIDFLEISGGSYEHPTVSTVRTSDRIDCLSTARWWKGMRIITTQNRGLAQWRERHSSLTLPSRHASAFQV